MRKLLQFDKLTSGQYESVQPGDVPSSGWQQTVNFIPFNQKQNRRGGTVKFSLDARDATMTEPVSSVIPVSGLANPAAGLEDWALCTISRAGEVEFVNPAGAWQGIVATGSAALVAVDEMPWRMLVRNSRVYALRRGAGRMRRIEGGVWRDAGRPAPIGAPTLGNTPAATSLQAGTYLVAYGYYDSETGYYGNPGPTASITIAAGDQIDVSNLVGKSTAFFADKIVVYMTQLNGQALFEEQQVACPDAPSTTTATISNVPVGAAAPTRHLQPSANATWVEEWGERFWWAVGSRLHYSPVGEFEAFSDIQALDFETGSGSDIQVIYGWGNKLVVAKRRKIFHLVGFDRTSWETKPWSTKLGCVAPHSMRNCEGQLIFRSEDGFAISREGEEPQIISSEKIGETMALSDQNRADLTYAEVWPEQSIYMAVFPADPTANTKHAWLGVVYNWRQQAWGVVEFPGEPRSLRLGYDDKGNTRLFAVMNNSPQVYAIFEGDTDDGQQIRCELLSGAPSITEEVSQLASIHSIRVLTSGTRWPLTFEILGDGVLDDPLSTATVNLEDTEGWKRVNVHNLGDPRTQLQVRTIYEGRDPFWIAEWAWDVMPTKKHQREY